VSAKPVPKWYAPIFALGPRAKAFFTCVIKVESRSTWTKPNTHDGDPAYPGQYGIFQMTWPSANNAWDAYVFPTLHVEPRYASALQQAKGAAILWKTGDAVQTWSLWDGCYP
jgi:inorganic pyrophosphatase